MATSSGSNLQGKSFEPLQLDEDTERLGPNRPTQRRIRIRIPKEYNDEPVISRLVSQYGVTVNITAALLGANARDDGWFDIELRGTIPKIDSALIYLHEMDLEIWGESGTQEDGW